MTNPRILYDDKIRGATITSSGVTSSSFAATNAANDFLGIRTRVSALTDAYLRYDHGSAVSLTAAAIILSNITSGASVIKLQHSPDDAAWTDAGDFTWRDPSVGPMFLTWASISRRYWRLKITDASNTDGYISIARWMLGTYFEPARGSFIGASDDLMDYSQVMVGTGGVETSVDLPTARTKSLQFLVESESEHDNWLAFRAAVKSTKYFLVSLDPDNASPHKRTLFAKTPRPVSLPQIFGESYVAQVAIQERV